MNAALEYCKQALSQAGVDKYQCTLTESKQYEMNLEGTEFTLMRTNRDNTLGITVIKDNRKGSISINRLEEGAIDEAIETALELLNSSQQDPDYDIAPRQDPQQFVAGPQEPDLERMYELLKEYAQQVPAQFPAIKLMETIFVYRHKVQHFINSNGVDFVTTKGVYDLSTVFSSREGDKATSFNYTGFAFTDMEKPLLERGSLKTLLQQSVEHLNARPLEGKFVGDVIITPDCLHYFIHFYMATFLGDGAMIAGTSPFKDKLGQQVADSKLTISAQPVSPQMADGYFVTGDGFAAENVTFIDKGVLKSFLLSQYGSKKTKQERAKNAGGCWVVEPGNKSLEEMISQVERGVLVARYSGGGPSPNGDFSGVAKNSYYIENGKIMYPLTETMVSGNLAEVFRNVKEISAERIDYGMALLPYVLSSGVTISGK
ncbi:MAG: TldD/PmbA family protein [Firmicutes bacterium]|nr:TldD/PmbA family protein [Bacillota bacterium]